MTRAKGDSTRAAKVASAAAAKPSRRKADAAADREAVEEPPRRNADAAADREAVEEPPRRNTDPIVDSEAVEATKAVGSARAAKAARVGAKNCTVSPADKAGARTATGGGRAESRDGTTGAGSAGNGAGPAAGDPGGNRADGAGTARVSVRKTYKLYIGGSFPRSESGRSYAVSDVDGRFLANAAQASRKDVRDAVVAARKAQPGWARATAYNRGQVLYRVAEMLEGRRAQFAAEVAAAGGAESEVDDAIDRWVWYAGWADKVAAVLGTVNPVAGPYFDFSFPEPTGVVGVLAPQRSALLGLVSVVAPVIATGNACVVVASGDRPLPAITLAEVLATSDLPGGVVNLLTGSAAELAPWLATHADVNALDLTGADADQLVELEQAAAQTVKRILPAPPSEPDWTADPGTRRLSAFLETKTVWHPLGV